MDTIRIAAVQMTSGKIVQQNICVMQDLVAQAAHAGAQWVVLPEYWPIMGQHDTDKIHYAESFGKGIIQDTLNHLAQELHIVLFAGSIPLRSHEHNKVFNSLLCYDSNGTVISRYDKVHLFGFSGMGERYHEADTITAGVNIPNLCIDGITVAQGICYDLRFPEFFRAQLPFDILILPAAFTYQTGQAHWETLLKARAIENQCFVIAAAQGGLHENGRQTFGHSMIIDPWGNALATSELKSGIVVADCSLKFMHSIRQKLPALTQANPHTAKLKPY